MTRGAISGLTALQQICRLSLRGNCLSPGVGDTFTCLTNAAAERVLRDGQRIGDQDAAVSVVGGIAKHGVGAETDVAEVDLILAGETGHRADKTLRLVELQRARRAGEGDGIFRGCGDLESPAVGNRGRIGTT
jgi:hypothetical protein